ncbi:coiled-coil domain-containing protein 22 homolog [Planococcus citri]|uniref:coiled-coil domain-containing protein 22 homolog n=1 Tax=Planococcus citri TaxID=170843 RepID=UPI0031F82853
MDDVDQIVLSSLKEIGYEAKDDIYSLKLCPFEDLVEMAICCINTIKPDLNFPRVLPPSMSIKFNMCNQLATICNELGYKGDVGYHTFLYTNVTDVRNVIIFLVQHLPRQLAFEEIEKTDDKNTSSIRQKTAEELKKILSSKSKDHNGMCLTPFISTALETGALLPNQKIDCQPLEWRDFVVKKLPFVDEQVNNYESFLPSLISLNSSGILNPKKPKCFSFNLKPLEESFFNSVLSRGSADNCRLDTSSASEVELPGFQANEGANNVLSKTTGSERSSSETDKEAELASLEEEIKNMQDELATLKLKFNDISKSNTDLKKKLEEKTAAESTLEQSLQLLPDSENNIPKLLAANEKVRNKIEKHEAQWQQGKEVLLKRKTELEGILNTKTSEKNELIENILELRKELLNVAEQIEKKKILQQKLAESDALKGVQRNEYIQRIFEIIKNIKKQGKEIDKILVDMRYVQKEINTLSGKIDRSFAVAEQMVVSNSRNDELSLETHKLLLLLHKDVSDILTMVGETGNYVRESKDLEEQLQTLESSENISESFEQVSKDLKRLKEEEASLLKKLGLFEKKQPESTALPPPKSNNGDRSETKLNNIVIDRLGYPALENFKPVNRQTSQGSAESSSKTKSKQSTSS